MKRVPLMIIVLAAGLLLPGPLKAVPLFLNYQGRMTQAGGGGPVPDSTTNTAQFSIFNAPSGGTALWTENDTVTSKNGLFNVELGHASPLNLPFDQPYWMEISWWGTTMAPRQPLDTAPYAFRAAVADNATTATSAVSLQVPQSLSFSTPGSAVLSGTNAAGIGLQGQGALIGVQGQALAPGGSGVFADYNGIGGAYALSVSGPARFMGGSVSFTGSVDFSGATVTGLGGGVSAPLSLTNATGAATISAFNTGGIGLFVQGMGGISVTSSTALPAIYAQGFPGGFQPAINAVTSGTGYGVEGSNSFGGGLGILGGGKLNGQIGVYGSAIQGPAGILGEYLAGPALLGQGQVGVMGKVTLTGQTAVVADGGGVLGTALAVSGSALFYGGPVSFTGSVDFSGATVTGLGGGVTAPLNLSGTTALGGAVISGSNLGAGYGLVGSNSQPGTQDVNGNPLTINAGVYGYTSSVDSAGVFGVSTAATSTAGVAGRGYTGVYGESTGYGTGGEFQAISGTGVGAFGVTGVAGTANTGGVGVLAYDNGHGAGTLALMAQGASMLNGPVTITANTNPGQAALQVQSQGSGVALYTNGGMASAYQAVTVSSTPTSVNFNGAAGRLYVVSNLYLCTGYLTVLDPAVTANSVVMVTLDGVVASQASFATIVPTTGGSFTIQFSGTPNFSAVDPNNGMSFLIINLQ